MFEQIVTGWACDTRCLYSEGNSLKANTTNLKSSKHFSLWLGKVWNFGGFSNENCFFFEIIFSKKIIKIRFYGSV